MDAASVTGFAPPRQPWRTPIEADRPRSGTSQAVARCRDMSKTPERTPNDRQHQAALRVSTKQIAKDAVRGGPKSVKKDKRPTGQGQKG